jgi:hypothetical protein
MILFLVALNGGLFGVIVAGLRVVYRQHELISYLHEHWVPGPALVAGRLIARGEVKE